MDMSEKDSLTDTRPASNTLALSNAKDVAGKRYEEKASSNRCNNAIVEDHDAKQKERRVPLVIILGSLWVSKSHGQ